MEGQRQRLPRGSAPVLTRITAAAAVSAYAATFAWAYGAHVAPYYAFWGLDSRAIPSPFLALSVMLAVAPALWLPRGIGRPSLLLFLVQYLVLFVPGCFVLYQTSAPVLAPAASARLLLAMFAGLTVMQAFYLLPTVALPRPAIPPRAYTALFSSLTAGLMLYVLSQYGSNFAITDFRGIYAVRQALAERMGGGPVLAGQYAIMWLSGFCLPAAMAFGLQTRRLPLLIAAAAGYVALYGIAGNKLTLLAIVFIPALHCWARWAARAAVPAFAAGITLLLAAPAALPALRLEPLGRWFVAVVHQRIFSIPSLLIAQYHGFFEGHPLTYFSHIRGIHLVVPFPFGMDLSRTVGLHYYGELVGSNANFWAGDGLAGFGMPGVILMSLACGLLFWAFDSVARGLKPGFVMAAAGFAAASFANIPLPTLVLSGGFGLLLLALWLLPREGMYASLWQTAAAGDPPLAHGNAGRGQR